MADEQTEQEQPASIDAERAVLGSIIVSPSAFSRVKTLLDVEDFYRDSHQTLFRAMSMLVSRGQEIDLLTLKELLRASDELESAGGSAYISGLIDGIPDVARVETYAKIVIEKSRLRQIITTANRAMKTAFAQADTADEITSQSIAEFTRTGVTVERESKPLFDVVIEQDRIDAEHEAHGTSGALRTGFERLDERQAIRPTLVVVASRSGHGKSAFLLNLWTKIAMLSEGALPFYSFEMTGKEVRDRIRSIISGVPLRLIRDPRWLSQEQRGALHESTVWMEKRRRSVFFADRIRTVEDIYADARRLKASHGLSAIFVDYLQLLRGRQGRSREEEMAHAAAELLEMAIELHVAVIAASQVNKDSLDRDDGRLRQGDLKYAAAIGDSARVVLMFQRPWYEDKQNEELRECETLMQIEKNSEGTVGDFPMHFSSQTQRFSEGDCSGSNCPRGTAVKQLTFG